MSAPLVTIASFPTPVAAQLCKSQLEAAGIPCRLANEGDALAAGGLGRVSLQVPPEALEAARALLERGPSGLPEGPTVEDPHPLEAGDDWRTRNTDPERCLVCQGSLVEVKQGPIVLRVLRVLVLQVLPLPAAWLEGRGRRCGICGHEWRADDRVGAP